MRKKVIIMGAAGRDFHNFNTYYRDNPGYEVIAFTATQIPGIDGRAYPTELAGEHYPDGIPIIEESQLPVLIGQHKVDEVVFSYSDVSHQYVMEKASLVMSQGTAFKVLGADQTQIESNKPLISICAVRTGCGKSQTSRYISRILGEMGTSNVAIRHPMPYGDLREQICQRFADMEDLKKHKCTIEEMEEYEPHIANGFVVYAGVDYGVILSEAEKEADVILWDGGNNDFSFYKADLNIVIVDPHRPGHEIAYYPGLMNLMIADMVIVNKVDTAKKEDIDVVLANVRKFNPYAHVVLANSPCVAADPAAIKGKKVLVVEDGPTVTHGGMGYGAGLVAARQNGAAEFVDARPHAVGSIKSTFEKYNHIEKVLPAMGYGPKQMEELEQTINAVDCDVVVIGTPIDLARHLNINKPTVRVTYELEEVRPGEIQKAIEKLIKEAKFSYRRS